MKVTLTLLSKHLRHLCTSLSKNGFVRHIVMKETFFSRPEHIYSILNLVSFRTGLRSDSTAIEERLWILVSPSHFLVFRLSLESKPGGDVLAACKIYH